MSGTTSTISSGSKDSSCGSPVPSARGSSTQLPPRYPTAAPAADAKHSVCSVLPRLAVLAGEAAADGRLPAAALSRAGSIYTEVRGLPPRVWAAASVAAVWEDPRTRCGLVTLLSYIVRQLLEGPAVTGAALSPAQGLTDVAVVLKVLVSSLSVGTLDPVPRGCRPAVAVEVVRLLVATDAVQCLTRLLAARTPTVVAVTAPAGAAASGEDEAPSRHAPSTDTCADTRADNHVLYPLCRLLHSLSAACSATAPFGDQPGAQAALQQLRSALLRSRTLEHATRSAILLARQVTAPDGGGSGGGGCARAETGSGVGGRAGAEAGCGGFSVGADTEVATEAEAPFLFLVALSLTLVLGSMKTLTNSAAEVWTRVAVSGPCVQHFLLLHAVSQLCAADGGPDYGLPPGARLPPLESAGSGSSGSYHPSLWPDLVAISFGWWAHNWDRLQERSRPCSPRALRAVCKRTAAAGIASACWGSDWAAAAAAVTDGAGLTGGRFAPPESAMAMTLTALWCAVRTLPRDGSVAAVAEGSRRLWAPVVQAARAALRFRSNPTLSFGLTPLQLLMEMPRPRLSALLADTAGSLPAEPGPDLAAALAAGYLPTLEQTIRHDARSAGNSPEELRPVLHRICSLLSDLDGLAALLAYGDLTHASALLATCIKVVTAAAAGDTFILAHLRSMLVRTAAVASGGCCRPPRLGPADRFWWRRRGDGSGGGDSGGGGSGLGGGGGGLGRAAEPPAPLDAVGAAGIDDRASAGGTRGRGNGGVDTGANGSSAGAGAAASSDSAPPLPPLHRLSLLGTFAATHWLPVLRRMLMRKVGQKCHFAAILPWFPPLLEAYRQCNTPTPAASEATQLAADGAAVEGAAADAAAAHNRRRQDAASWERLLLGELDVPGILQQAARELAMDTNGERRHPVSIQVAFGLLYLLAAFPLQGRKVLRARISLGAGQKAIPLFDWLRSELAAPAGVLERVVTKYLQLAAAGAAGAGQDLARWLSEDRLFKWPARLGALLPPPCFVAEALPGLLPLCANPGCTNLEGDSEAGRMVQAAARSSNGGRAGGSGGSGGAAPCYCCRACQRAHSRA